MLGEWRKEFFREGLGLTRSGARLSEEAERETEVEKGKRRDPMGEREIVDMLLEHEVGGEEERMEELVVRSVKRVEQCGVKRKRK